MNCCLCEQTLRFVPSWRGIFLYEPPEVVCQLCRNEFSKITGPCCKFCGKEGETICRDCHYWEQHGYPDLIRSGKSLYHYNDAMKDWFHQYKFLKDVLLAQVFAKDLREVLKNERGVVVPIPLNEEKLRERSFSQVDQLLLAANIPYRHLLEKCGETLGEKTRQERMATKQLFRLNGEAVPKQLVLVDDLYTTGTTMRQAAKTLQQAGAESIRILTLIRA
ncbi:MULTISPECIES: ComF family protein [unclassified Planococcus (in: firmicutes)]|uniref:ComF family protein n=1 Tax=unclassified Planococcus (in: firmicutes) TaxID=2662419 RepID=UPI0020B1991C|nr:MULTISPECIES: ComF family protein [unclassified Planococcus (in: firmicutes)]